ncbi:MAG: 4a-hydroxytetrahydrobiopterin dehydratase, partial [Chloroflexota bacterium]|nr:4a-hydroxytetrahydrobiopterin dehydratase [Chloroflexota bacterium]
MTTGLAQKYCIACEAGTPPMPLEEAERMMEQVPGWELQPDEKKLVRRFKFKDFKSAMSFVNKVAD